MSDRLHVLDDLASIVTDVLAGYEPFITAEVPVINETPPKGVTPSDPAANIAALIAKALADIGVGVIVRRPVILGNDSEAPCMKLSALVEVECKEEASLNVTGLSQSALALHVATRLHGMTIQALGMTLNFKALPVETNNEGDDAHLVQFEVLFFMAVDDVLQKPTLTITDGEVTMTHAVEGVSIYYATAAADEPMIYPSTVKGTLYEGAFASPAVGTIIYAVAYKTGFMASELTSVTVTVQTMPEITNLQATDADHTGFTVSWDAGAWDDGFDWQVKLTGDEWQSFNGTDIVPTNGVDLHNSFGDGLQPTGNQSLMVRVRPHGGPEWSEMGPVMTGFDLSNTVASYGVPFCQVTGMPDYNVGARPTAIFSATLDGNAVSVDLYSGNFNVENVVARGATNTLHVSWSNDQRTVTADLDFYVPN